MCSNYVYFEIEVQGGSDIDDDETLAADKFSVSIERIGETESASGGMAGAKEEYFVESFGEVFLIQKWIILRGCMYYTQDEEMSLYKYDLEDLSILLSLPSPDLPTPWFQPEWLMITAPLRDDDKRHMDKVIEVSENIAHVAWNDEKDDSREATPGILDSDDFVCDDGCRHKNQTPEFDGLDQSSNWRPESVR
ncbi:hypothetical protein MKW92_028067 [Papaver armeniacum]|nr:hypothetical protein MKW92_028067 [Papaver armeniacum]